MIKSMVVNQQTRSWRKIFHNIYTTIHSYDNFLKNLATYWWSWTSRHPLQQRDCLINPAVLIQSIGFNSNDGKYNSSFFNLNLFLHLCFFSVFPLANHRNPKLRFQQFLLRILALNRKANKTWICVLLFDVLRCD